MKNISYAICVLIFTLTASVAEARFLPAESFNGGVAVSGVGTEHLTADIQTVLPLKIVDGYIGIQLHHRRDNGNSVIEAFKVHSQAGVQRSHVIAKGYLDLEGGHRELSLVRHAGGFVEVLLRGGIGIGIGSYAEVRDYLKHLELESAAETHFGWRGHLNVRFGDFACLVEYLPQWHFGVYAVRITPVYQRHLFGPVSLVVNGEIRYDSETAHIEIEPWHVEYKKLLQFEF
ncbi:hypothetical protein F4Y93_06070 [Candidatus Poribacteria bacterium]|nr:hypothetical protein [Candidatus Poribacteria bacterium]